MSSFFERDQQFYGPEVTIIKNEVAEMVGEQYA